MSEFEKSGEYRPSPAEMAEDFVDITRIPAVYTHPELASRIVVVRPDTLANPDGGYLQFSWPQLFAANALLLSRDQKSRVDRLSRGFHGVYTHKKGSPANKHESDRNFSDALIFLHQHLGPQLGIESAIEVIDRQYRLSPDLIFIDEDGNRLSPTLEQPVAQTFDTDEEISNLSESHQIGRIPKQERTLADLENEDQIREAVPLLIASSDELTSQMLAWSYGIDSPYLKLDNPNLAKLWEQAKNEGGLSKDLVGIIISPESGTNLKGSDIEAKIRNLFKSISLDEIWPHRYRKS